MCFYSAPEIGNDWTRLPYIQTDFLFSRHAVLMITPPSNGSPAEPPLPSKLPSVEPHPSSLGSKLAAHFTPLRSPSRNSKARYSTMQKSAPPTPPLPSPTTLSPPVHEARTPSLESQHSSMQSRSTTPRPLRGPYSPEAENGDDEEFSDLFTRPDNLRMPQQLPKSPSTTSVHMHIGNSPKKSGELSPATPITPSGPSLQFPIPPSTIIPPRSLLSDKGLPRHSSELASLSSQRSRSSSKRPSPIAIDNSSTRSLYSDFSSQDERQSIHQRTSSISGSDTDRSKANDSTYPGSSFKLPPVFPKHSSVKAKLLASSATKVSSGPPPSVPLPSPPLSPNSGLIPRSAPIASPNRVVFPRPRANTLSVTSNLVVPGQVVPKSNHSPPPRSCRANSNVMPDATTDELRDALSQQCRKNAQLQEYILSITKRHQDDRTAMTKTIEKLERNVRKKMREIEGLRWLVIHNGAVSDIDAAAHLARSSLSTQDGDAPEGIWGSIPLPPSPMAPLHHNASSLHQSTSGHQGASITVTTVTSTPDIRSDTSSSAASFSTTSVSETTSLTTPFISAIPGRMDGISRAQRQKLKEERRASKALRRISAISTLGLGSDPSQSSSADSPLDSNFDPKQSMDEVFEKLQPFRHN